MRQLILDCELDKQNTVTLIGKNYRYLVNVLRLKESDVIDVRLKNGALIKMELISVLDKKALLKQVESLANEQSAVQGVKADSIQTEMHQFTKMWLFQFLPQGPKMDLIVRQATECGVSVIVPIIGQYSKNTESNLRFERWNRIIKEARQQSGSPIDTQVTKPCTIQEACTLWNKGSNGKNANAFILHEDSSACKNQDASKTESSKTLASEKVLALAVGSEGGFSADEFEQLKNVGFCPIHFKTNVLRCETAALYGIAVIQQMFG